MGSIQDTKLKVIIVGAGIAGLAVARVLREHHDVTVFERASLGNATGGQGICFFPSTVKILQDLGYSKANTRPCHIAWFRHYDRVGNETENYYLDFKERYGEDMWGQMRSDARDELYRLATGPLEEVGIAGCGGSIEVNYDTSVVDVDADSGLVTLENGSSSKADLVVVADGIHSKLRKNIVGPDPNMQPKKVGFTIVRVAVPVDKARDLLGADNLPHWIQPDANGMGCLTFFQSRDETRRLIVTYPLRSYDWIHISLHLPTENVHRDPGKESWYADADKAEILEAFADFDDQITTLVRAGTELKVWDMQDMDPLPHWHKGRAILIGDAAHAMTPMQGQGGNMAVEDAEAFSILVEGTTPDQVSGLLEKIDRVRRPRTAGMLAATRATTPNTDMTARMNGIDAANDYYGIDDALRRIEVQG